MLDKKEQIKKEIEYFFTKMSLSETPCNFNIEREKVCFEIKTENPRTLIGKRGEVISNIQFILGKIIQKKMKQRLFIDFDVNGYKKKKEQYLKELARDYAQEVSFTKKIKTLPSLSSYERRIIHLALQNKNGVKTESRGQEPNRKIIIKPV